MTINSLLTKLEIQQKDLLEESSFRDGDLSQDEVQQKIQSRSALSKILIQAYSHRGKANKELNDNESAANDFSKLIELAQF